MKADELRNTLKFAENLKILVEKNRLTLSSLSKKFHIGTSTLHNYCYGVLPKGIVGLICIAKYFDISLDELVFGDTINEKYEPKQYLLEQKYEITIKRI